MEIIGNLLDPEPGIFQEEVQGTIHAVGLERLMRRGIKIFIADP